MTCTGTVKGNRIEFDHTLPFTEGLQVVVNIMSSPPIKGSPQAWLTLFAGTADQDEAELVLAGVRYCRTIDAALWESSET